MPIGKNTAAATKAAIEKNPVATNAGYGDRGIKYAGVFDGGELASTSKGGFMAKLRYTVEGLNRPVYENIVFTTPSEDGTGLRATKNGESSLARRLAAFGVDSGIVATLAGATSSDSKKFHIAFANGMGALVDIYLRERQYMGKTQYEVASVWPGQDAE